MLLDYTNEIFRLMDEAKTLINPEKWNHSLTLGASQTISAVKIPQLLSSFFKEYQNIEVKVRTNNNHKLEEMLFYGELDGIFVSSKCKSDNSQFKTIYSYYQEIVLITPVNSHLEKLQDQTLIVNSDQNCIYRNSLLDYSDKNSQNNPNILELDTLESILQAVSDGLGISLIPSDIAEGRKNIQHIKLIELPEKIKIDFLIKNKKQQKASLNAFIRILKIHQN